MMDEYFTSKYKPDNTKEKRVARAKMIQRLIWSKRSNDPLTREQFAHRSFNEHNKAPYVIGGGGGGPAQHGFRSPRRKWDKKK